MSRDTLWTNQDGLRVGFGTHSQDNDVLAVVEGGTVKQYTIELPDATLLEDTDAITVAGSIPPQSVLIPRGSVLKSATFSVTDIFTSGGAATLDIGFYSAAAVVDDANGIDVDLALTVIDAIGDIVVCDGALVGGVVPLGATSNSDVVVVFGFEAAVYTAGAGVLTLEVIVPHGAQGRVLAA